MTDLRHALHALADALADTLEAKASKPRRSVAVPGPSTANDLDRALARRVLQQQGVTVPKKGAGAR